MITDRLRTEAGLMTLSEKLRFAVELLADVTQVLPTPELRLIVQLLRELTHR